MSIQYASDLHLEHDDKHKKFIEIISPRIGCDILILAGDIGNPRKERFYNFMKWCVSNWKYVIIIAGNHEYYSNSIKKTNTYLYEMSLTLNFIFLNNSSTIIGNLVIIGSTFWSYIPDNNMKDVVNYLNDFNYIEEFKKDNTTFNKLHKESRKWMMKELKKHKGKTKIVVTHHAPVEELTSSPIYRGKPTNKAFASNCDELLELANVWIYGHTHYNNYPIYKKCLVITNQRGYRDNCKNYRKQACIVL